MRRRKPLIALVCAALIALSLGLTACGGDDDDSGAADSTTQAATTAATTAPATPVPTDTTASTTGGATTVALQADASGQLKFQETTLTAKPGKITIDFSNPSAVPHNVAVDGASGVSDTVQDGGAATLTVDLPAGTYQYYCDIPGHREAGMVGELTVR